MHSLAIALKVGGYEVTGSDDEIREPSRSRLAQHGLLPAQEGWDPERIHAGLDAVVLGMHATADNPELLKAQELGLKVYSYPEFIYQHSQNKQRIVVAGSYGKTTITSMIMHVLKGVGKKFDYLVGSQVKGFDNAVSLSKDAPIIVLEGDEYLASKLDPRPKFLVYQPHIVLLSGVSWDHINVFPTEVEYNLQFGLLLAALPKGGYLIYNEKDATVKEMAKPLKDVEHLFVHGYNTPTYKIKDGVYTVVLGDTHLGGVSLLGGEKQAVKVIGKHNMNNIAGAWKVCEQLGVTMKDFLQHIATFEGAKSRLEIVKQSKKTLVYKDFAHAPAKVCATLDAVRELYPKQHLIACLELHTFSSLNRQFLKHYHQSLKQADKKIVFVSPHNTQAKGIPMFSKEEIQAAFGDKSVMLVSSKDELQVLLRHLGTGNDVYLMMSSGNFDGLDLGAI